MAHAWDDHGLILSVRRHGEHDAIISLLTEHNGRYAGLVKAGFSRRMKGSLQPGNALKATWRARLEEHLGTFTVEFLHSHSADALTDPDKLAAMSSACALVDALLPERQPHPEIYAATLKLFEDFAQPHWLPRYAQWELELLRDLGFGLDLSSCAATGSAEDLTYVSPRSGRAVSTAAAAPYAKRLLALPGFLRGEPGLPNVSDILSALALTGHFFATHVFSPQHHAMPAARERFVERLKRLEGQFVDSQIP
ncbi:MAG: DNA repair protein RecO [Rhodospirillaceae bacterium]|nr:DNA repair protein RecO [Rhodospirillaceae bacterium]